MSKKRIISIGVDVAHDDVDYQPVQSKVSLLDYDIVIFRPEISGYLSYNDTYLGKCLLDDDRSFKLQESLTHWRDQILDAVSIGKVVFVYLSELREAYIATGEKTTSGTGRNQKVTRIVTLTSNYHSIPMSLEPQIAHGERMRLDTNNGDVLRSYWNRFVERSAYNVILNGKDLKAVINTEQGNKLVGTIGYAKHGNGCLILLPDLDFYSDEFLTEKNNWTKAAKQFSSELISELVSIEKSTKSNDRETPEPSWSTNAIYVSNVEQETKTALLKLESKISSLHDKKRELSEKAKELAKPRSLLYEKGKILESAVIQGLQILGFNNVENYEDNQSEFDVLADDDGGRLIGEVEGKDNTAVAIGKLRQLLSNVQEDFQRDEIDTLAKGVLFGNGFRFEPPEERDDPFSQKCKLSASSNSIALVSTVDLFFAAQYVENSGDLAFAKECRVRILTTTGRVSFPEIPKLDSTEKITTVASEGEEGDSETASSE